MEKFHHEARWNDTFARIEMHAVADEDIGFTVLDQTFSIKAGETIHTENSHKFDARSSNTLLLAGHWTPIARWTDAKDRFSVILAEATIARTAP